MSVVLEIQELTKIYKKNQRLALDNLSLSVESGSIYAFVGPNGAGKTTAIRIITTLLAYDTGSVKVGGYEVAGHPLEIRRLVGYIPDEFGFYEDMLVSEYLAFFSSCYGVDRDHRNVLVSDLLELVGLAARRDDPVGTLSRGMRQRLGLARALINDPELIVADEPASSLDPRARYELREMLLLLKEMGKTIFLSSHILRELDDIATHMGIIDNGRIMKSGLVEQVRHEMQSYIKVRLSVLDAVDDIQAWLALQPVVTRVYPADQEYKYGAHENGYPTLILLINGDDNSVSQLLSELVGMQFHVFSYTVVHDSLESIFMQVTRGGIT